MGVVVRRYIDILTIIINFTPLVLALFLAAASLLLCSFFKCFLVFNICDHRSLPIHGLHVYAHKVLFVCYGYEGNYIWIVECKA